MTLCGSQCLEEPMSHAHTGVRSRGSARDVRGLGAAWLLLAALPLNALAAQQSQDYPEYDDSYADFDQALPAIDAQVWFDRGNDPLLDTGDRVRVYYRTSEDAYVAVFHIDTDGRTRLVYPTRPGDRHYVRGDRDYRLLFGRSQYWYVDDEPGLGYYFIVASAEPMDFSQIPYSSYDREWDLTRVGNEVYSDPYVAMDEYVAALVPDWEYIDYGLDFAEYSVGRRHQYPRFMCYDCHGYRPYYAWNPYAYSCSTFRVVLWDDPYYYPPVRYRGDRVVFVGRRLGTRPRYEFKERGDGDRSGSPLVQRRTGPQRTAQRRTSNRGVVTSPSLRGTGGESSVRRTAPELNDRGTRGSPAAQPRQSGATGGRVSPPRATGGEGARRGPVATQPSTRFRDSQGSTVRSRPPAEPRERPQLERRRPGSSSSARPSQGARPRGTATTRRQPMTRSDSQGRVRTPPRATSGQARPSARPSRSTGTRVQTPNARSRPQAAPTRRPTVTRGSPSSSSGPRVRPQARSGGSSARARPSSSRPRATGSSPSVRSRPAPSRRPVVKPRRKPGG